MYVASKELFFDGKKIMPGDPIPHPERWPNLQRHIKQGSISYDQEILAEATKIVEARRRKLGHPAEDAPIRPARSSTYTPDDEAPKKAAKKPAKTPKRKPKALG